MAALLCQEQVLTRRAAAGRSLGLQILLPPVPHLCCLAWCDFSVGIFQLFFLVMAFLAETLDRVPSPMVKLFSGIDVMSIKY